MKVINGICTTNYTEVYCEDKDQQVYNAPHHFKVISNHSDTYGRILSEVNFQKGPIKETGVNGVHNEDLILMVLTRLQSFQETDYACRENAIAITKLEEALMWLRARTQNRQLRGVEGTSLK